ncbi:MAG: ferrous iron transport protein B [Firmicutes bacterium]|nr:ferrous iron transport protein B [Bacillota bacterium]
MRNILAIPVFAGSMLLVFYLTFGSLGPWLSSHLSFAIDQATSLLSSALLSAGVNPAFHALVIDGVCAGVGSVLSFLPVIAVLFFCLSLMEGSGYTDRMAVLMDRPMRCLGLSGRCLVPLLMGFGCSVPAIMAARSLARRKERLAVTAMIPFMSCSAKLPLYSMFAAVFFPREKWLTVAALYAIGLLMALLCALLFKKIRFPQARKTGSPVRSCISALPSYRIPSMKRVFLTVWENVRGFVKKAFTVIFTAAIIIWFLQSFDMGLHMVDNSENSILAAMGKAAAPIFAPLGFGDWRSVAALITGLSAKEAIVSTLAVLTGAAEGSCLSEMLAGVYTPLSAFSFLVFCLLYTPCIAALAAARKEWGAWPRTFAVMFLQCAAAWIFAFLVFQIGGIFV